MQTLALCAVSCVRVTTPLTPRATWLNLLATDGKSGDTPELQARLLPMLVHYGVNAYFTGHDHHMSHMVEPGSHLQHFMPGSGAMLHEMPAGKKRRQFQRWALAKKGVASFKVTACAMDVRFVQAVPTKALVYTTTVPNYRRDWLKRRRGLTASGTCPATPHDVTYRAHRIDHTQTSAKERALLTRCQFSTAAMHPLIGPDITGAAPPPVVPGPGRRHIRISSESGSGSMESGATETEAASQAGVGNAE